MSIGSTIGSFFGFGSKPTKTPTSQPSGSDGVMAPGGFLVTNERSPDLIGANLQKTILNTLHQTTIIAAAARAYLGLVGSAEWHAEPGEGRRAQDAADLVKFGLLDAPMPNPWPVCAEKQGYFHLGGFAIHEWVTRRRRDGRVVFAELGHRPQATIWRWDKTDERKPLQGVEQMTTMGSTYYLPRQRLWYTVDNILTDSPAGMGVLRHVVDPARKLRSLTKWEGFAYEKDLRGDPIGYAPLSELAKQAETAGFKGDKAKAYVTAQTKPLGDLLRHHLKGETNDTALLLDSITYSAKDAGATPTAIPKWALKILTGDSGPLAELNTTISRITWEIATLLQAEWLLIGQTNGTYNLHDNKTEMMAGSINRTLGRIGSTATQDLARPLVAMNGYDPETETPRIRAQPVSLQSVQEATTALAQLATAGAPLRPDDTAIDQIRRRLHLDAQPKFMDLAQGTPRSPLPREPRFLGKPTVDKPADDAAPLGPQPETKP